MLHIKDSHKLFEFKAYFNSPTQAFSNLVNIFGVFSLKSITKGVFDLKTKGYTYGSLLQVLVLAPFLGAKNIHNLFETHYQLFYQGKKDSFYETLRNANMNWRLLLFNFAKRFLQKTNSNSSSPNQSFSIKAGSMPVSRATS